MALKIADYYRAWADENAKIYLKKDINVNELLELSKDLFNHVDQRLSTRERVFLINPSSYS